jgi:hypothetical protein
MIGLLTGLSGLSGNGNAIFSGWLICLQDGPFEWLLWDAVQVQTEKKNKAQVWACVGAGLGQQPHACNVTEFLEAWLEVANSSYGLSLHELPLF